MARESSPIFKTTDFASVILVTASQLKFQVFSAANNSSFQDFPFENIRVVSAGARDPDAEGATGMSASKMRRAVTEKNFTKFS